jgi:hypothetical protein
VYTLGFLSDVFTGLRKGRIPKVGAIITFWQCANSALELQAAQVWIQFSGVFQLFNLAKLLCKQQRQHLLHLQQQNSSRLSAVCVAKRRDHLYPVRQGIQFVARVLKEQLLISILQNDNHA